MTNATFSQSLERFTKAMRRPSRCLNLEYLIVREWKQGVAHAHALIRCERLPRSKVKTCAKMVGLRAAAKPLRNVQAAVRYVFKDMKNPDKKPELPPPGYRGRLFTASARFLTKPIAELWRDIQNDRREIASMSAGIFPERRRE